MIYSLIKLPIRLALCIFCVDIELINPEYRSKKGPLLLVANHPNSFLDAIIIAAQFRHPVYFLARGDAFRKPWQRFLLSFLHMIPVYRLSEGRETLLLNKNAFKQSQELLTKGKIVLIFIEGVCLNTHKLQPFKKGAARIAITAVKEKLPLYIMPVSVSYNSFTSFGKSVRLELRKPYSAKHLLPHDQDILNIQQFNTEVFNQLNTMVKQPQVKRRETNIFLFMISLIGHFLHWPIYRVIKRLVQQQTNKTVFYDSVLFGALLLLYPLYLLLLMCLLSFVRLPFIVTVPVIFVHLLTAWFAVRYKIKP